MALAFRKFRSELIADGWFQRNLFQEAWLLSIILACACGGTYLAYSHPLVAVLLLALAMQQANYFAHDLVHGHGNACWWVGNLVGGIVCGYSRIWWSDTHNKYVCVFEAVINTNVPVFAILFHGLLTVAPSSLVDNSPLPFL